MDEIQAKASNILNEASYKFELLKLSIDNFNLQQQLELLSSIRNHILNSSIIKQACEFDNQLAKKRGEILDTICIEQNKIFTSLDIEFPIYTNTNTEFDYSNAKESLIRLTTEEIEDNSTWSKLGKELVSKMEEFKDYDNMLYNVRSKCQNDKYNILLIGEYQSGKTTTFNALCGGRSIGPIGSGTKTSAVPLSVSYSEKESINIIWKSKDEIVNIFSRLLGYCRKETLSSFDIDINNSRNALLNEIEEIRTHNKTKDLIKVEDVQFIILCSIILLYWNSREFNEFKNNTNVSLDMVSNLTKFPQKMFKRWWKKGCYAFTFQESVFIFIKQIECSCASEALKSLNGTIIDCPGLFATKYDTYVTEQAMLDADAIWYIYPRERQAGEQSNDFLTKFKSQYTDYFHKLYATNNLSLWNRKNSISIYEANRDDVRSKFGESKSLTPYDAYIAYLGYFKLLYDNGELDEKTITEFIEGENSEVEEDYFDFFKKPDLANFEEAWQDKVLAYTKGKYITANDALDLSKIRNVIEELRIFIECNKAYSIIISEGANKLQNVLKSSFDNYNRKYIEPYKHGKEGLKKLWEKRIARSIQFEEKAKKIVHATLFESSNGKDSLIKRLSDSVYKRLFTDEVYDSMSENICDKLYAEIDQIKKYEEDKEKLQEFSAGLVTKCISDIIYERVSYWNELLSSNQDKDFSNMFVMDINEMERKIESEWNTIYYDDKFVMTNCYKIIKDTKSLQINSKEHKSNVTIDNGKVNTVIALNYASIATMITGMVGAYALYLVACVATGPIGWLIGGLTTLIVGFWTGMSIDEYNEKRFKEKMMPDLKKQLEDSNIKSSIRNMIYEEIKKLFNTYEKNTKVDDKWLQRERDTAISRLEDPRIEEQCYMAVGAITRILSKNEKYNNLKKELC